MSQQFSGKLTAEQAGRAQRQLRELDIEALQFGSDDERCLALPAPWGFLNTEEECAAFMRGFRMGDQRGYGRGYRRAIDFIASGE